MGNVLYENGRRAGRANTARKRYHRPSADDKSFFRALKLSIICRVVMADHMSAFGGKARELVPGVEAVKMCP